MMINEETSLMLLKSEPKEDEVLDKTTDEEISLVAVKSEPKEEVGETTGEETCLALGKSESKEEDETQGCVGGFIEETYPAESSDDKIQHGTDLLHLKEMETILFDGIIEVIRDNSAYTHLQYRLLSVPGKDAQFLEISRKYCDNTIPIVEAAVTVGASGVAEFRVMSQLAESTNILDDESRLDRAVLQKAVLVKFGTKYRRCLGLTELFKEKFGWPESSLASFVQLEEIGEPWSMVRYKKCERWYLAKRNQLMCGSCRIYSSHYRGAKEKDLKCDKDKRLVAQSRYPISLLSREERMIRQKNMRSEIKALRNKYKRLHQYFLSVNEDPNECTEVKKFVQRVLDKRLKAFAKSNSPISDVLADCPTENGLNLDDGQSRASDLGSELEFSDEFLDFVNVTEATLAAPTSDDSLSPVLFENTNTLCPPPVSGHDSSTSRRKSDVSRPKKTTKKS